MHSVEIRSGAGYKPYEGRVNFKSGSNAAPDYSPGDGNRGSSPYSIKQWNNDKAGTNTGNIHKRLRSCIHGGN